MAYRPTMMDRFGPRAADYFRAAVYATPVAMLLGVVVMAEFWRFGAIAGLLLGLAGAVVGFVFVVGGAILVSGGAGAATQHVMLPSGSTTPTVADFSYEKALVMKGQI